VSGTTSASASATRSATQTPTNTPLTAVALEVSVAGFVSGPLVYSAFAFFALVGYRRYHVQRQAAKSDGLEEPFLPDSPPPPPPPAPPSARLLRMRDRVAAARREVERLRSGAHVASSIN
jgi:hypothetical protein